LVLVFCEPSRRSSTLQCRLFAGVVPVARVYPLGCFYPSRIASTNDSCRQVCFTNSHAQPCGFRVSTPIVHTRFEFARAELHRSILPPSSEHRRSNHASFQEFSPATTLLQQRTRDVTNGFVPAPHTGLRARHGCSELAPSSLETCDPDLTHFQITKPLTGPIASEDNEPACKGLHPL
jgi:hypothetical protein